MKIKTSVLSVILFAFGACAVTDANAGFLNNLKQKASRVAGRANQRIKNTGDKLSSIANDANKLADKVSKKADQGVKQLTKGINTAVGKGKELRAQAVSTGKQVVTQAKGVKNQVMIVEDNVIKNANSIKGQLENLGVHAATEFVNTFEQNGDTAVELVKADTPDESPDVYPEDVVEKIDALIPDEDTIAVTKTINLAESNLTDDDIPYLTKRLSDLVENGVKKVFLILSNNSLTIKGVTILLDGLKTCPQFIRGISFSGNPIGDEGAVLLVSNLENMPLLKYICLSGTGLTGDGALALIVAMSKLANSDDGSNLRLVDFSHNKIEENYLEQIVANWQSVKNSQNIVLRLQDNPIQNPQSYDLPRNIFL